MSAKKNLFLETGWYRPLCGFQCLGRDFYFWKKGYETRFYDNADAERRCRGGNEDAS